MNLPAAVLLALLAAAAVPGDAGRVRTRRVPQAPPRAAARANATAPAAGKSAHAKEHKAKPHHHEHHREPQTPAPQRVKELVLGILGNSPNRGVDILNEEVNVVKDGQTSEVTKDLTSLFVALQHKEAPEDKPMAYKFMVDGITEYGLNAAKATQKVETVLAKVLNKPLPAAAAPPKEPETPKKK